jgi:hypothetical protein
MAIGPKAISELHMALALGLEEIIDQKLLKGITKDNITASSLKPYDDSFFQPVGAILANKYRAEGWRVVEICFHREAMFMSEDYVTMTFCMEE